MAFVPAANVAQVNLRYVWNGERCENTLYFRQNEGWSPVGLSALADRIFEWWDVLVQPIQHTACSLREIYVRDLEVEDGNVFTLTPSPTPSGTTAGEGLPNNCTLCVSFRTGLAGRTRRGRNYMVGMGEAHQSNSYALNSYALAVQTAYEELLTFGAIYGFNWVIISRYSNGLPRSQALVTQVQAVAIVDLAMDSQRRRLPGRGV